MKKRVFFFLCSACFPFIFQSCTKEDLGPVTIPAPEPNTLSSDASATTFELSQDNADKSLFILSWNSVQFNSTKAVNYTVELDSAGRNFAKAVGIGTTGRLSDTVTVEQMNQALTYLGVSPGETATVEIRVRSWIDFLTDPALSNVLTYTVTPYLITFPPIFIIGDAQGWDLGSAAELDSHTPGIYTGEAMFQANGHFRFFQSPDWGANQWGFSYFNGGTLPDEFADAGDGDSNFNFTGQTAKYIVTVSLPDKKITIEPSAPLPPPPPPSSVFVVSGGAVDFSGAMELKSPTEPGLYEGVIYLDMNTKFRFFAVKDWSADKWDWTSFDGGVVDSSLGDSGDDIHSILFTGASGYYAITVSFDDKTISLEPTAAPAQTLYIIGDAQGWNLDAALEMNSLGGNQFEAVGNFVSGKFRFFVTPDWSADQFHWSDFVGGTVDSNLADGMDGDSNFSFVGTPGVYDITVSINDKTITMTATATPTLFIIGDDQAWNLDNAFSLTWDGGGKYEGTTTFTNNSIFRFFETADWAAVQYHYSTFADGTITGTLADGGGADSNLLFTGTTGSHTIHVDLYTKIVEIE